MSDSAEDFGFSDKQLSLIDVSFEDDCLYTSPCSPNHRHIVDQSSGLLDDSSSNVEVPMDSFEDGEKVLKPLESLESESVKKSGKYNLRKSLAWDSAFFTSEGVLEPDELSSMIGDEKRGKCRLPGIEEDVCRSNDSFSTLASDGLALETLEADLFGDIRASIQKSSVASNARNLGSEANCGVTNSLTVQSSEKTDSASEQKSKAKAGPKKLNAVVPTAEKVIKQSVGVSGESKLPCKPPKAAGRISPIITTATKRASLGANRLKVEKDNARSSVVSGRGAKITASIGSRNAVPRPTPPSRSSLASSMATKTELKTSSSVDSSGSLSSDNSSKSSSNSFRRKTDARVSSRLPVRNVSRVAPKHKNQPESSHLSPYLKSLTKISSSVSPSSSISEWSSGSLSPTSTLNKGSSRSKSSIDASTSRDPSGDAILDSHNHSNGKHGHGTQMGPPVEYGKRTSMGSGKLLQPDSVKPTGLRMPSPKIGFFDGGKSSVRTSNESIQPQAALSSGLPRCRAGSVSPSGGSNGVKFGKLQTGRTVTAVWGSKSGGQQASGPKSKSPSLQGPSGTTSKVCSASRDEKQHSRTSPKILNRSKSDGEGILKTERVASKEFSTGKDIADLDFAESNGNPCDEIGSGRVDDVSIKVSMITPISGLPVTANNSSTPEVESGTSLQEVSENAIGNQSCIENNSQSLHGAIEKGKNHVEGLTQQIDALDIQREISKEPLVTQDESMKLTKSTSPPKPAIESTEMEIEKTVQYSAEHSVRA